jgi:hypothetical protein
MTFARLMATPGGRFARVIVGGAMMYAGFGRIGGSGGIALGIAGLVPLLAGAFNFCAISKLIGTPFWRRDACGAQKLRPRLTLPAFPPTARLGRGQQRRSDDGDRRGSGCQGFGYPLADGVVVSVWRRRVVACEGLGAADRGSRVT